MKKLFRHKEAYILCALLVLIAVLALVNGRFFTINNFTNILRSNSVLAVASLGMLLIMLTGGIDISIAAVMTASALYAGRAMAYNGLGIWQAFLLAMAIGVALELVNGFLIGRFSLPPIIITLGTKSLIEGVIYLTTGGKVVNNAELPAALRTFSAYRIAGVPVQIVIMLALVVLTWALLRYTMLGRSLLALGGNPRSAVCAGVRPLRMTLFAYGFAGAMAALAGMLNTSIVITVSSNSFTGYEMNLIAALVVGGVSLSGGRGSPWNAFLGVMFMAVIVNGMTFAKISTYYQDAIVGAIILCAATVEAVSEARRLAGAQKIEVKGEKTA